MVVSSVRFWGTTNTLPHTLGCGHTAPQWGLSRRFHSSTNRLSRRHRGHRRVGAVEVAGPAERGRNQIVQLVVLFQGCRDPVFLEDVLLQRRIHRRVIVEMLSVLNLRVPLAQLGQAAQVDSPSAAIEPAVNAGLVNWWPAEPTCPGDSLRTGRRWHATLIGELAQGLPPRRGRGRCAHKPASRNAYGIQARTHRRR